MKIDSAFSITTADVLKQSNSPNGAIKSKPVVPPKPKVSLSPDQILYKSLADAPRSCCKCVENKIKYEEKELGDYGLSIQSNCSEATTSSSSQFDAYNLLDEIYAEIEDKNKTEKITLSKKLDFSSLNNSDNSNNSSSSISSSCSSYSFRPASTKSTNAPIAPPPPLPLQPPPPLTKTRSNTQIQATSSKFDNTSDEAEQSYLEPALLNQIDSEVVNKHQSSILSSQANDLYIKEKGTKRRSSILKAGNNRLISTLKIIRKKSFIGNGHASYSLEKCDNTDTSKTRHGSNVLMPTISEPQLISQTYDFNKTTLIMLDKSRKSDQPSRNDELSSQDQNGIVALYLYLFISSLTVCTHYRLNRPQYTNSTVLTNFSPQFGVFTLINMFCLT
jgi:hypothetical protein